MTVERVDYGKSHSYYDRNPITGNRRRIAGVTTIIGDAVPKKALAPWYAKMSANEAIERWDELAALPLATRYEEIRSAAWRNMNRAAAKGTLVHSYADRLYHGQAVDVPPEIAPYVDSCVKFLNEWEPEHGVTEATVVNRSVDYAGTLDLLTQARGELWLFDWKTGSGVYADSALQLVAYANAETILIGDEEQPMMRPDRAGIVHLRPDGYDVYPTSLDDRAWQAFRHVRWLARVLHEERENGAYISELNSWLGSAVR